MTLADNDVLHIHGPEQATCPIVLDSPHSGFRWPAGFDGVVSRLDLRAAEDCFIDELWRPAAELGIPLLAAQFPRTWIDPNRHAGDIDLDLIEGGSWPGEHRPSGKARIGKALIWRTLDDGRPIYARRLTVAEVQDRIDHYHLPYQHALARLIKRTHHLHGRVVHLNCHSMNAVSGAMGEGGAGQPRADIVLGDRDGTTCAPALTALVRQFLSDRGYEVKVNDPFKGVELVRAFSDPGAGRHSLQIEVNKRLYMHSDRIERHAGFTGLQTDLMALLGAIDQGFARA